MTSSHTDNTSPRIDHQVSFIGEIDKLKTVERRARPVGLERRENSAEHSWHVLVAAMVLHEHANQKVELLKVIEMLAIHDIVEIDAGDTFHFHKSSRPELADKEQRAAERLFGMLPSDQAVRYRALWKEFESRETPEARFAAAVDRLMPILLNFLNKGGSWIEYGLSMQEILKASAHIVDGSSEIWQTVQGLVQQSVDAGYISAEQKP